MGISRKGRAREAEASRQGVSHYVVWRPLPGSQSIALACPANDILYEGTRGPGKTDAQLMYFRKLVGAGYGSYWRGVIFDKEYKHLDDLVVKSKRWFSRFNDGAKFVSGGAYKWVWPTGEELLFRVVAKTDDYWNYHGHEYPFIGWNELSKYATPDVYDMMMSCNRSSFLPEEHSPPGKLLPEIPLVVFSTSNPFGAGHNWIKRRFIDPAPPGVMVRTTREVFNPRTQQKEQITRTQVRLFGSYKENRYLAPEYILGLESITEPNKRRAWLYGDWDITSGGMLDDLWDSQKHIVEPFAIPQSWTIDRSFDWGSSKPFSVLWWAESDGSPVTIVDGVREKQRHYPRGSVFLIGEWYGSTGEPNKGLMMASRDIAKGILEREKFMRQNIAHGHKIYPGPADSSIYDEIDAHSIASEMAAEGVRWVPADKSSGSRKRGAQRIRDMLTAAAADHPESPGLWVFRTCQGWLSRVPVIPRSDKDPDDVDTETEDHDYDATRYRLMQKAVISKQTKIGGL